MVSNAGGCTMSDGQQWCEVQAAGGGARGWVAARFLALPSPETTSGATGRIVTIAGVPDGDVLNVRSGPGTGEAIVGALSNDTQVRELRCEPQAGSRWCEIEMMTDMRGRGWINARYIVGNGPSATQLPSAARMERVRFDAGASGAEVSDQLGAGTSVTYLIGAGNGQMLYTRVAAPGSGLAWRLYNPDGSLLDEGAPSKEYRGQLFQSGDHRLEVVNRSGAAQTFNVIVGID
ncbi:SH3 domain-containing protein [Maribius pontilimi]|uniref:SH3 domain-containing protein n=2 Tax=Palleronia pontilimi TaxID=1964209 RepID=A0A934IKI4_9RHOB|nr:SH3 domain-containing protein [Palleronia pontilimi]